MERMLELLLRLGELKNYTLYGPEETWCPPIILVWYRQVQAEAAEQMNRAIASYRGSLEWSFLPVPEGWAVVPKRLPDLAAERELGGFLLAARVLMDEEPTFAELARTDLESLAEHVS